MRIAGWLVASLFLVPSGLSAQIPSPLRRELPVRCARGQTINEVLARLDKGQPSVLRVFGTCRESVQITGFDDLRVVAGPGAVLESVPGDSAYPISVSASRAVSVEGLTIRVTDSPWKPALFRTSTSALKPPARPGKLTVHFEFFNR